MAYFLAASALATQLRELAVRNRMPGKPRVPLAMLASVAGISRRTVYNAMQGQVGPETVKRLSDVLCQFNCGEFAFARRGQQWQVVGDHHPAVRHKRTYNHRPPTSRSISAGSTVPSVWVPPTAQDAFRALREAARTSPNATADVATAAGLAYAEVQFALAGRMSYRTQMALMQYFFAV